MADQQLKASAGLGDEETQDHVRERSINLNAANSFEAMRAAMERKPGDPEANDEPLPLVLEFDLVDPITGKSGTFKTKYPTVTEHAQIGVAMLAMSEHVPLELLPPDDAAVIRAKAWCMYTLIDAPDWFKDPNGSYFGHLLVGVGMVCWEHHARRFRQQCGVASLLAAVEKLEITRKVGKDVPAT